MKANDIIKRPLAGAVASHKHWLTPVYLCLLLLPVAFISNVLFHTLAELFAIGIAMMSFVVAWTTFVFSRNQLLLYLGCGYFWIGLLDLAHTLTFEGMGIFDLMHPDTTLQLWIVARFLEAFLLLSAPLTLSARFSPRQLLAFMGVMAISGFGLVYAEMLPPMLIPGEGLTTVKVISEYIVVAILLLACVLLYRKKAQLNAETVHLLIVSIMLTIAAEVSLTLYAGFSEFPLLLGHLFKILSYWAIYRALIESSLLRPFGSLSLVVDSYEATPEQTVIIDQNGIIQRANKNVRNRLGDVVGRHCHEVLHARGVDRQACILCVAMLEGRSIQGYEFENTDDQQWYEATLSAIYYGEKYSVLVHTLREITIRKRTEQQFIILNRLYRVLRYSNEAIAHTHDTHQLFQKICDIAVTYGEFKMAWIGIIAGDQVRPEFVAGSESGYLLEMQMKIDNSKWAQGPVGLAAKTRKVSCVNNVRTEASFEPWRAAAIQRGYAALAAAPLILQDKVIGIFTLYSARINVFDSEMLGLLKSLSDDISAAIFHSGQAQDKQRAEETVRKLSSAVEQSANAILITDTGGVIEYANSGFSRLTGYRPDEVIGRTTAFLHENRQHAYSDLLRALEAGKDWSGEVPSLKKDGATYWSIQSVSPIRDEAGTITNFVLTSTDNTDLHQAQDTIRQLAFYDPLTRLANRRLLMDRLEHEVIAATRHQECVAVMLCDLDNFKMINDSLGHDAGDRLLQHVAATLTENVRAEDTVARLGGDEFVAVISGIKGEDCVIDIANNVLSQLEKPIDLSGTQVSVSSSIGVAVFPKDGQRPQELLRNADLAMYHAKDDGKNRFQFYRAEMNEKAQARLLMESRLRRAIEEEEFQLLYQPQVNLLSAQIVGFEALIRWRDADGEVVFPDTFIPLAEETGLIGGIGDWVIKQAFKDWGILRKAGFEQSSMAVNVSAFQFRKSAHLQDIIQSALADDIDCVPQRFVLELTESTLVQDIDDTIKTLHKLKALGISISIDDFGTGYSSLNYLKRLPFDELKIDRTFTADLQTARSDQAIVSAMIALAQKLELKVVAEGVEEASQADFLIAQGCRIAQGYYYHVPLPLERLLSLKP